MAWIGLRYDESRNGWYWVDGVEANFSNPNRFGAQAANFKARRQYCGSSGSSGAIVSWNCISPLFEIVYAICEKKI